MSQNKGVVSVYLEQCKSKTVNTVLTDPDYGWNWKVSPIRDKSDVIWTDGSLSLEDVKALRAHQIVNHIPGMQIVSGKSNLTILMKRMSARFPGEFDFYPPSWNLPSEILALEKYVANSKNKLVIIKPSGGSQGRGISVINWAKNITKKPDVDVACVVQAYIHPDVIIKTIISSNEHLRHIETMCPIRRGFFEVLGFDILLDDECTPFLLEVNQAPSFRVDGNIDKLVKESVLADTLQILDVTRSKQDKKKSHYDTKVRNRALSLPVEKENAETNDSEFALDIGNTNNTGFKLIYPKSSENDKYEKFFVSSSLYKETAATVARKNELKRRQEEKEKEFRMYKRRKTPLRPKSKKIQPLIKVVSLKQTRTKTTPRFDALKGDIIDTNEEIERIWNLRKSAKEVRELGIPQLLENFFARTRQGGLVAKKVQENPMNTSVTSQSLQSEHSIRLGISITKLR